MKYQSINEITNFDFNQASIGEITYQQNTLKLFLDNVTIRSTNSNNRDIRDMRANDFVLTFEQAKIMRFVAEGYKVYDADNNLTDSVPDAVISEQEYPQKLKELSGSLLYSVEESSNNTCKINIDGEYQTYVIEVEYTQNCGEWDRFLSKEPV